MPIFFDQHNLVIISNSCSRAGSVLHLILVFNSLDVSSTQAPIDNWYRRTAEQNRCLPISPMPLMMRMMWRYSGSVKGDRASDNFPFPWTSAFLMALIRVVIHFNFVGLPLIKRAFHLLCPGLKIGALARVDSWGNLSYVRSNDEKSCSRRSPCRNWAAVWPQYWA